VWFTNDVQASLQGQYSPNDLKCFPTYETPPFV
jgi:hypothetical protein